MEFEKLSGEAANGCQRFKTRELMSGQQDWLTDRFNISAWVRRAIDYKPENKVEISHALT